MDTVDLIIKSSTEFYNDLKVDENGRYRSWEHWAVFQHMIDILLQDKEPEGSDWKLKFEVHLAAC